LTPRETGGLLEVARHVIVNGGRDQRNVGGHQHKRRAAIVEHHNAMPELVEHAGGLPRRIAEQRLRRIGRDVDLYGGRAELGAERQRDQHE